MGFPASLQYQKENKKKKKKKGKKLIASWESNLRPSALEADILTI